MSFTPPPAADAARITFVAPTAPDSGSGSDSAHPTSLATAVAHLQTAPNADATLTLRIQLEPGIYILDKPLTFRPETSDHRVITLAARLPGTVTLSGGVQLTTPWKSAELNGRKVWSTPLPDSISLPADSTPAFRSLWINNTRRMWARYPNDGTFARVEGIPERPPGDWTAGPTSFRYAPADAAAWHAAISTAELTTFTRWIDSHLRIASLDESTRLARFTTPNTISLDPGDFYILQGASAFLDQPGEWWCDNATRTIYTIPLPGDTLDSPSFVPRLTTLLDIAGDPEHGHFVENITFEGLTFSHQTWWFAPGWHSDWPAHKPVGFNQAAAGAPGAITLNGAKHITFRNCTIRGTESYGIELARGCTDCTLDHCTITDLGAGGVKIGEPTIRPDANDLTARNTISDCTISDGGHIHHQAVGVWLGQSSSNTLSHNLISDFDYTGISIGWTWGYGPSAADHNSVEWNEIRNLGSRKGNAEPPLGDMGGIYTLGIQPGTVIHHNFFHDIAGHTIAWGIYFDEGTTGVLAEHNIVLRTTHGGFHQHYGKDNILRNNLFLQGRDAQLWRTRREDHNSFTFEHNLVIGASPQWMSGDWSDHFTADHNLYWRTDGKPIVFPGNKAFADWQAAGHDVGSIIAGPDLILDPPTKPRFGPKSQAKLAIEALPDLTGVGPRQNSLQQPSP